MTVNLASPRAKPRWLTLALFVLCLTAISAGAAAGHGATTLPAGYLGSTQEDVHGANDVPGQVDVTMMGRNNTEAPKLRIFWSWDSITSWTGTGQTGDACALFDSNDSDVFINYVVCARIQNVNADPNNVGIQPAATNKPVYPSTAATRRTTAARTRCPGHTRPGRSSPVQLETSARPAPATSSRSWIRSTPMT